MKKEGIYQFGKLRVDAQARALQREEEKVTLNRRAFDVLLCFVQNPGKVLTRDELIKNVWPDTYVDENSLAQSISALRRALEEEPGDNNYIVTLQGRGYQFVVPVQVVVPESLPVAPNVPTDPTQGRSLGADGTGQGNAANPGAGSRGLPAHGECGGTGRRDRAGRHALSPDFGGNQLHQRRMARRDAGAGQRQESRPRCLGKGSVRNPWQAGGIAGFGAK